MYTWTRLQAQGTIPGGENFPEPGPPGEGDRPGVGHGVAGDVPSCRVAQATLRVFEKVTPGLHSFPGPRNLTRTISGDNGVFSAQNYSVL